MRRIMAGAALTMWIWTTASYGAIDAKACERIRLDTVQKSIATAEFIDAHIEKIPPVEETYLTDELRASLKTGNGARIELMSKRPYYVTWQFRKKIDRAFQRPQIH